VQLLPWKSFHSNYTKSSLKSTQEQKSGAIDNVERWPSRDECLRVNNITFGLRGSRDLNKRNTRENWGGSRLKWQQRGSSWEERGHLHNGNTHQIRSLNLSDPFLFTRFLLEKAQSKGVNLVTARATSLSVVDGRVTGIDVDLGDMKTRVVCDKVVIAAGPWSGPLSEVLLPKPIPITSYAGHSILIQPSVVPGADCLFMTVRIQNSAYDVQIIPRSSGEIYISGVNDTLPLPSTPDAAIPLKTEIDKLKEIADIILPRYSIKKEQLCFRPMTDKGTPFICPYVAVNGVYIGVGHGHFGIILGPGTGKVLSEMILGEKLSADISQLSL